MSAFSRSLPWFKRPSLSIIAAPAARLLSLPQRAPRLPHDWREIERFRLELEMKKASLDLAYRFKVM